MKSVSLTICEDYVVLVLDAISFPILFDTSKIKKITGSDDFFSSLAFTGRYCVCQYLDPSQPNHSSLKLFISSILHVCHRKFIPLFRSCLDDLFTNLETELAGSTNKGHVDFISLNDRMCFDFVFRLFCDDKSPSDTAIGSEGPELVDMAMLQPFGLRKVPRFLKDFARNMNLIPNSFFTSNYNKLCDPFEVHAKPTLDEAVRMGIKRDEACHNLVFFACSNAYGGFKAWFPVLIKWVGLAGIGKEVHKQLANEIRTVVNSTNRRETDDPTLENKQCPGKDMAVMLSKVMLVELLLRYDTFAVVV
ncbi:hypothetical protein ACSBR1_000270 [Camellia fascicularis]